MSTNYITAEDGTVVAWGEEPDPSGDDRRWGASAWTAHPQLDPNSARHIDRIAADTTHARMSDAIDAYLRSHRRSNPEQHQNAK